MKNESKTLYIPLYGKACVSRKGIILSDPDAERIWQAGGFPLRGKAKSKWLAYYMGMRSAVFDRWAAEKMQQNPGATVLHIGCGMDSRCNRIAAARQNCLWYDIDFPDVIVERRKYYSEDEGYRMQPGDASRTDWLEVLPGADTAIVIMEGISMYLAPDALRALLSALRSRYAKLHLLMDCYTEFGAKASRYKNPINTVGVTETYGMETPRQLAEDCGLRYLGEMSMTPEALVSQLRGSERFFFRKVFAGGFAGRIYKLYGFEA